MTESVRVGGGRTMAYGHPHDLAGILEVFVMDVYRADELPRGALVIDLGAGLGDYTVAAGRAVGPGGFVIALEPSPTDFARLAENVRDSGLANVVCVCGALGREGERLRLRFKELEFEAVALGLETLLRQAGLDIPQALGRRIYLKIDIEGAEVDALGRLEPLLPSVELVAIELHGTKAAVDRILLPLRFEFRRLTRFQYLSRSLRFVVRHPVAAVDLWRRYRASDEFSGMGKILRGIEISASDSLIVGTYQRAGSP
ncbi:MAG: FkbM family methyltransferase [Thermoplasmata archaeon]|nr:FkbM family methyltransferase [Thermoplasmata archaeon]